MNRSPKLNKATLREIDGEFFKRFRGIISREDQSLIDRVRRSVSWLRRAVDVSVDDCPPRFADLWIALNALYGVPTYEERVKSVERSGSKEKVYFRKFMMILKRLDSDQGMVYSLMKDSEFVTLSSSLVRNKYLWNDFWRRDFTRLRERSSNEEKQLATALQKNDVVAFYASVFARLLILRNQIFHGSSSSTTKRSEDALKPGIEILEVILPQFIHLMIQRGSGKDFALLPYPGRKTPQHPE